MRSVALIGKAMRARAAAPLGDRNWEIWGLGWDTVPRVARMFELHGQVELDEVIAGKSIMDRLKELRCPVYMQEKHPDLPNSVKFPIDEVIDCLGIDYFGSTFAFMLGLAIYEKYDRIGIWGVDLNTTEEYAYQRPNAEFLIGLAIGRGIKVRLPPNTNLLRAPGRYGWEQEKTLSYIRQSFQERRDWVMAEEAKIHDVVMEAQPWG